MKETDFDPAIAAVVSIRHLVKGMKSNWKDMMRSGNESDRILITLNDLVTKYGVQETQQKWKDELKKYRENISNLKAIMQSVKTQIQAKKSDGISQKWNEYPIYVAAITTNFEQLNTIGMVCLPEIEIVHWKSSWTTLETHHEHLQNEAVACYTQLQMIETYTPTEMDVLTQTILKHIPMQYTEIEAEKYTNEYMEAFEAIKKEASQKKNLWDRFLDILAGGVQQTPAQRVMMQRWVNGEKGEIH